MGIQWVGSRVIPYKKSGFIMVEVECPLCTETIDLGVAEEGAYVCPYCEEEFHWEPKEFVDKANDVSSDGPKIVSCRECTKRTEIPDGIELYLCRKCGSPLAEYPNIMADEKLFSFNNGINKWVDRSGNSGPRAGIESTMHRIAENSAIGIITGRIKPTFTFSTGRKFVQTDKTASQSEHMGGLMGFWWAAFFISIPIGIFAPPLLCFTVLSFLMAIESGTQKKMNDVVLIAASKHPHLLAEEGACYCYIKQEELILGFLWKGHTIDINTAVRHQSDCYLKINWTNNTYGSHDNGYSVSAIEAVLRYPGRQRKIVMLNHEYVNRESAEEELIAIVRRESWYPVLGAKFQR